MEGKVTPRAIAYVATIVSGSYFLCSVADSTVWKLVFNLTDAIQWTEVYNEFSFRSLYNFIVDYFEDTSYLDSFAKERNDNLLKWWNK